MPFVGARLWGCGGCGRAPQRVWLVRTRLRLVCPLWGPRTIVEAVMPVLFPMQPAGPSIPLTVFLAGM